MALEALRDCRLTTRDGHPGVEWTWDGNDETDPAQGRGWAVLAGGESAFVAERAGGTELA